MRQNQIYLHDTYCFSSSSEIIASGLDEQGQWVACKDNIFHPQGGGQPADVGWVEDIPIRVRKHTSGLVVFYPQFQLKAGKDQNLTLTLSANERLRNAALHTSGHLLNWTMRRYGWMASAGHHFPDESRVEFTSMGSEAVLSNNLPLQEIEESIAARLQNGGQVKTWQEGDSRWCLIADTEPMLCAGTHVNNLNRIVNFVIKSIKFKKGTLRISYDAHHLAQGAENVI